MYLKATLSPTAKTLVTIIYEGLKVLVVRDCICVPDAILRERANNIAAAILGNLDVSLPED
jgi:hypothetical protein